MTYFGYLATGVAMLAIASGTAFGAQTASAPIPPDQGVAASAAGSAPAAGVEDIVVTAQRRSERLQNVPVAVTAVSAYKLATAGITNTQELSIVTPGLSAPQVAGYTQPHIRGVGSSTNGPGLEQPVATYIDGVYIAAAPASLLTLNNVERIEVLKGPQGTLFGRNATGGLIQVITKDPTLKPTAAIDLSYANYRDITSSAYVSTPLLDTLSADLAVRYETQQDGWGRNLSTGMPTGNLPHDFAARTKILFKPSGNTEVRLALDYEDRISRRDTQKLDQRQFSGTFNNAFFGGPFPQGGQYDINNSVDPENSLKAGGASLAIVQRTGSVTIQSITAYRKTQFDFLLDIDQTPSALSTLFGSARDEQFSQELQLSSNSTGRLKWTTGVYFYSADDRWQPLDVSFGPSVISPVPNQPVTLRTNDRMRTDSLAGYAQATYEVLPSTDLTLGARYTYEKKRISGLSNFIVGGFDVADTPIPDSSAGIPGKVTFKRFNYRIALDHKFGRDILGYISYNTGFKSGGYNLNVPSNLPYQPEQISAAEIGLKTEFLNRRIRLNTAAYYYNYKNIQVGRFIDNVEAIYNGAGAHVYGIDLDGEIVISRNLSLSGGFAYNHATFSSFPLADYIVPVNGMVPPPGGTVSASANGNDLPFSPKVTFNVGGTYKTEVSIGTIEINATYFRTSRYFAAPDNVVSQPAYDLVNMSVGWTEPGGRLSIKGWGKNLGNTYYSTSLVEAGQGIVRQNGAPRTYGVTLSYRY